MPDMQVSRTNGVATISGNCADNACKVSCETITKEVKGVKSIVNNCLVVPPAPVPALVESNTDQILVTFVTAATKPYSDIPAAVEDGVVTFTVIKLNEII